MILERSLYASTGHFFAEIFFTDAESKLVRNGWDDFKVRKIKRRALARMRVCGIRHVLHIRYSNMARDAARNVMRALVDRQIGLAPFTTMALEKPKDELVFAFARKGDVVVFRLLLAEFGLPL